MSDPSLILLARLHKALPEEEPQYRTILWDSWLFAHRVDVVALIRDKGADLTADLLGMPDMDKITGVRRLEAWYKNRSRLSEPSAA